MKPDDAVRLRRAVNRLARSFNAAATDEGLTPSQASVLGSIVGKGPLNVSDLGRLEHLNPTMLSRVIGYLDESGLIERKPAPSDLRAITLSSTTNGRAVHERIKAQRARVVIEAATVLSVKDGALLIRAIPALEKLAEALR